MDGHYLGYDQITQVSGFQQTVCQNIKFLLYHFLNVFTLRITKLVLFILMVYVVTEIMFHPK
jgi:hypothetical protein